MADDLHSDIVNWLHSQSDWLQDATERLLSKGGLSQQDIEELTEYLKTEEGQKETDHRQFTGLSRSPMGNNTLHLESIGNIEGIEKLSPRNPLTFGNGHLSVIYGHNGSGKSGYARVLKNICGKPRAPELKPNVFQDPPETQKCEVTYWDNGQQITTDWHPENGSIKDLEAVDLFDQDEADFYLKDETEVSYTPPEVALFENLAQVCDRVKQKLHDQQNQLVSQLPNLPTEYKATEIAKIYQNLKADIPEADKSKLINWSKGDQQKLNQLNERLKASDPGKIAEGKQKKKHQLDQNIISKIRTAYKLTNEEGCKHIQELKVNAIEKRRVATEGAQAQTSSAKFDGIGTNTWNALWEAARAYSKEFAYPDQEFPVTEDGARCVLCHQKLDSDPEAEAQQRLKDFENYVQGKLEQEAKEAEQRLNEAISKLPGLPAEGELQTICEAADLGEEWVDTLKTFWGHVETVITQLKRKDFSDSIEGIQFPEEILQKLEKKSEQLKNEVEQYQADAKEFDRGQAEKEKLELLARKWTSQQKDAINQELARLKKVQQYESWKEEANSRNVSLKARNVSKEVITDAYIQRFNKELDALGGDRLQVKLVNSRNTKGQPKHQIKLTNVQAGNPDVSILSGGERRIVSLAAFLADVTGRPETSPFIFDDPISSLDHDFEWEVAMRLASLAQERQVIVLTHRLSLYGVLEDAAKKMGDKWKKNNLEQCCIESLGNSVGHPASEQAWSQKTDRANNTLIDRLDKAQKDLEKGGDPELYKSQLKSICTDFRKLLERTVEDDLMNSVVKRHRKSVTTENKLEYLAKIEEDDCRFIDDLMTRYSKYEHSQSEEIPADIPNEHLLRQDLEALRDWRKEFEKRS